MKISRRNVLQILGLAGASYGASTLLGASPVRAGNPTVPKRIVFFYTEHGTLKQFNDDGSLKPFWTPIVNGPPDAFSIQKPWSTTDFTLRDIHQPLVARQKQILLLDGIDMLSSNVDPTGAANSHIGGETHALIAANRLTDKLAGGPSIDQFIAQSLNTPTPQTVLPSLEVFISPWQHDAGGGSAEASPLYASAGMPIPIYGDVNKIYDRMFPSGPQGTTDAEKAKQARLLAQQTSAIEAAYARFKSVSARSSALDRARLDAHAQALRDLEARLALASATSCTPPDKATITAGSVVNAVPGEEGQSFEANADVLMRLVQTSLACDLTRVATMYVPVLPDDLIGYTSVGGTTDFHDMVHKTNGVKPTLGDDPQAIGIMKAYQTYNAKMFAKFLDMLAAIPEADGTTLLDNTLVVWCGQIAAGDHSLDNIPYVLAGGMGGAVKTGRYVRYPRVKDMALWPIYSTGPAHNDLFVSLANLMGVQTSTFGNPAVCKGPLAGLTG
jgi:uncharacterized protein DUF1552